LEPAPRSRRGKSLRPGVERAAIRMATRTRSSLVAPQPVKVDDARSPRAGAAKSLARDRAVREADALVSPGHSLGRTLRSSRGVGRDADPVAPRSLGVVERA